MAQRRDKKEFVLTNLSSSTRQREVVALFDNIKHVDTVLMGTDPNAVVSRYFAQVRLSEGVQPYFEGSLADKVRRGARDVQPVMLVPFCLRNPLAVNSVFDAACQIIGDPSTEGLLKAEAFIWELAGIRGAVHLLETNDLIRLMTGALKNGSIDFDVFATKIQGRLAARLASAGIKKAAKKKKKKKWRGSRSVNAISTPMGGQPEWGRGRNRRG